MRGGRLLGLVAIVALVAASFPGCGCWPDSSVSTENSGCHPDDASVDAAVMACCVTAADFDSVAVVDVKTPGSLFEASSSAIHIASFAHAMPVAHGLAPRRSRGASPALPRAPIVLRI